MGGYGSGWQRTRKLTVEEGLTLAVKDFAAIGAIGPRWHEGSFSWRSGTETRATVGYGSTTYSDGEGTLWLRYAVDGKPMHYTVTLVSTVPHYGGRRWWFIRFRSCTWRPEPPSSPAERRTTSPTAPASRAAGEYDQKSFGVAWPSDSPVAPNQTGCA
jgi:hypothetical protein